MCIPIARPTHSRFSSVSLPRASRFPVNLLFFRNLSVIVACAQDVWTRTQTYTVINKSKQHAGFIYVYSLSPTQTHKNFSLVSLPRAWTFPVNWFTPRCSLGVVSSLYEYTRTPTPVFVAVVAVVDVFCCRCCCCCFCCCAGHSVKVSEAHCVCIYTYITRSHKQIFMCIHKNCRDARLFQFGELAEGLDTPSELVVAKLPNRKWSVCTRQVNMIANLRVYKSVNDTQGLWMHVLQTPKAQRSEQDEVAESMHTPDDFFG